MRIYSKTPYLESEKGIQQALINYLRLRGWYVQRLNSGRAKTEKGLIMLSEPGTPDLLAIKAGQCIFVEVKRPKKKPTWLQEQKMAELKEYGAKCFVLHSIEEAKEVGL